MWLTQKLGDVEEGKLMFLGGKEKARGQLFCRRHEQVEAGVGDCSSAGQVFDSCHVELRNVGGVQHKCAGALGRPFSVSTRETWRRQRQQVRSWRQVPSAGGAVCMMVRCPPCCVSGQDVDAGLNKAQTSRRDMDRVECSSSG